MTKYLIPFILIVFIGCNTTKTKEVTFFGGKIINPKSRYVTITDSYNFNDTIFLNKNNSFLTSYKKLKEGLYIFGHGPEHQYVYLQPNDSLLFRLNTWNFDESLVFSGRNAKRNNLLIESFLQSEIDAKKFYKFQLLNPDDYLKKIDSTKALKHRIVEEYTNNTEDVSNKFIELLNIAVLYPLYTNLEEYAIHNFAKKEPIALPDSYFNYRAEANAKKDSLIPYGPYYRYVNEKLYTDVYLNKTDSSSFNIKLLKSIDANITSEKVKNKLLYNSTIRHFFKYPNQENKQEAFFTFFKLNTNNKQKKNVQRLINDLKLLKSDSKMPSFNIVSPTGKTTNILKVIKNKNTVILFKDYEYASDEWIASRINHLIKKNPNIKFVVINLCDSKRYTKKIDIKYQYTIPFKSDVCNYSSSKFPRVVLVSKNGTIINGYTSLSAKDLNTQINNLQKVN